MNNLNNTDESQKTVYASNPTKCPKRQIYRDRKQVNGCLGLGQEWKMTANGQEASLWGLWEFSKIRLQ